MQGYTEEPLFSFIWTNNVNCHGSLTLNVSAIERNLKKYMAGQSKRKVLPLFKCLLRPESILHIEWSLLVF